MGQPDHPLLITPRFRVEEVRFAAASGEVRKRAVIRHPGAVAILPRVDEDRVCLIRNTRVSVGETLVELPAGTLEPDEDPREAAERELREETGFRAASFSPMTSFFVSPGVLDERIYLFEARGLTMHAPDREPDEQIENLIVSREQALAMVHDGTIRDAKTIVGLLLGLGS